MCVGGDILGRVNINATQIFFKLDPPWSSPRYIGLRFQGTQGWGTLGRGDLSNNKRVGHSPTFRMLIIAGVVFLIVVRREPTPD